MTWCPQNHSGRPQKKTEPHMVDHAWVSVYDCACCGTYMEFRECFDSWFSHSAIWVLGIIRRWSALAASTLLLSHLAAPLPLIIDLLIFFWNVPWWSPHSWVSSLSMSTHTSSQPMTNWKCSKRGYFSQIPTEYGEPWTNLPPARGWVVDQRNNCIQVVSQS